ncbi:hypothetical protein AYO44_01645 [Planctomycetaceae bacterium SCGC AG-212-F19]|nr:hypothetical protein AYO44_01645 [Planctomycetaceae bacterium SCGC AG-212-F19]
MTEDVWFSSLPEGSQHQRVEDMLTFLGSRLSRRKQVLLACASFQLHWKRTPKDYHYSWEGTTCEVAERFVDGQASMDEVNRVRAEIDRELAADPYPTDLMHNTLPDTGGQFLNLLRLASGEINSLQASIASGLYAQPFPFYDLQTGAKLLRDLFGNPFRMVTMDRRWSTANVVSLGETVYADRAFDRLPILADALEDAGCTNADVLEHCRSNGPHVRGCWVVDLILGKE